MIYDRQTHFDFLESELKAQTNAYKVKLDTAAQHLLLGRGEVFVAQFLTLKDGEMILKFSNKRTLPRKGDYLYCMLLHKELRDYHNWGEQTYGDLVKQALYSTEITCIWHAKSDDEGYSIAGFRGADADFAEKIKDGRGVILVLGPNRPPFEYITNLQDVVRSNIGEYCPVLDDDYLPHNWEPYLLDSQKSVVNFIKSQLRLTPTIILQGPPGTGKSYMIAELCNSLCSKGNSVLVTTLTNRALIEVAEKPAVKGMLNEGKILKTNLSYDEQYELPQLNKAKELYPMKGYLTLSTYFITSGALNAAISLFDYVIMDEASQALLAMFEVSRRLGKHNLWIGDVKQLPPVVEISDDKINRRGYRQLVDGLNTLTECSNIPIYQLTETFRLSSRAADYTKIFYRGNYFSKSGALGYRLDEVAPANFLHPHGGPTLIKTDFPIGKIAPKASLVLVSTIVSNLFKANTHIHIAVLSCMIETVRHLQKAIVQSVGNYENLIVDTIAKVQGLTTDVTIFVIPNTLAYRSLETRLFNVATSRAKGYTIIITDKDILQHRMSCEVRKFMEKLDREYSFYLPFDNDKCLLTFS